MKTMKKFVLAGIAMASVLALTACQPAVLDEVAKPKKPKPAEDTTVFAAAGAPLVQPGPDSTKEVVDYARTKYYPSRSDVFALLASERSFDKSQMAERIFGEGGGFKNYFELPNLDETEPKPEVPRPVPAWRLAGIVFSDGVVALMQVGNTYMDLYPGKEFRVGQDTWVCVSISEEHAVVRRMGANGEIIQEAIIELTGSLSQGGGGTGGGTGGGGNNSRGGLGLGTGSSGGGSEGARE